MKKLLIIGMADSVHLANWLQNMSGLPFEVTLVSSSPHRRVHPKIVELMSPSNQRVLRLNMPNWSMRFGLLLWMVDRLLGERLRGLLVRNLIRTLKPDLIHVVEFQHAGYILLQALTKPLTWQRPKIMSSNYGSDIYWFRRFSRHKTKISALLKMSGFYTSECQRDIALANELGFKGKSTLLPNTGGISEEALRVQEQAPLASERRLLLLKGYQNKFGQALQGVGSLLRLRKSLRGFEIISVSTNFITAWSLFLLRMFTGLKISFHLKGALSHHDVLSLMARARIYIGLSKSDGISTSLLEAMAMGAFPIQTGTSCASEWINHGASGAIVSLKDEEQLDSWILKAISDENLVNTAQAVNDATIRSRYTKPLMAIKLKTLYLDALNAPGVLGR
jgi:glycosyltransferase involved in cell wall biosynthesis